MPVMCCLRAFALAFSSGMESTLLPAFLVAPSLQSGLSSKVTPHRGPPCCFIFFLALRAYPRKLRCLFILSFFSSSTGMSLSLRWGVLSALFIAEHPAPAPSTVPVQSRCPVNTCESMNEQMNKLILTWQMRGQRKPQGAHSPALPPDPLCSLEQLVANAATKRVCQVWGPGC